MFLQLSNIYGDFWETAITSISHQWSNLRSVEDKDIPVIYTSLKLYAALEKMSLVENNDDFSDSWTEKKPFLTLSMITLVKRLSGKPHGDVLCAV